MKHLTASVVFLLLLIVGTSASGAEAKYGDGRPEALMRLEAKDHGVVLRYGDGPGQCDIYGARDAWVYEDNGTYYMHYDAAGPRGWLCSLATSDNMVDWKKHGPVLDLGKPGEEDAKSASYGVTYLDGNVWHMFYLGTPNTSGPPARIPSFPYLTMKKGNPSVQRTLGIARSSNLDGSWAVDPEPIVPIEEQIENTSLYYEKSNKTWFLFTNHIGLGIHEYTDAIWVYWSKDLNKWSPENKAVVLDGRNCSWSKKCIGLPSVIPCGKRLAVFYDAPGGDSTSHMERNVGLAWLDLPLSPASDAKPRPSSRQHKEAAAK